MNKFKKLIIAIIFIIISLVILFGKDFIIRQYFIYKVENVDYDEYILTTSYNGKKRDISYYSDDVQIFRTYDNDKLGDIITVYDYKKGMAYEYDIINKNTKRDINNFVKPTNLNNHNLLSLLNNTEDARHFLYKGTENVNNRECYVLFFEKDSDNFTTIYLDKELLYTIKEEDNHSILEYDLDLTLEDKKLFEFDLE